MLERAAQKLRLDQLVIQQSRSHTSKNAEKGDLVDMIQHGAQKIISGTESMDKDDEIDDIIRQGEMKTAELNAKYAQLDFDDLHNFKSEAPGTRTWEGETFSGTGKSFIYVEPSKRERKTNHHAVELARGAQARRVQQFRVADQVYVPFYLLLRCIC